MQKHSNYTPFNPQSEWAPMLVPILCVSLTAILMAACSSPAPDSDEGELDRNNAIGHTIEVDNPAPVSAGQPGNIVLEERTTETLPGRRIDSDTAAVVRNEAAQSISFSVADSAALASSEASSEASSQVVSQASSYRHREAERLLPYHGPTVDRENYLSIDENSIKRVSEEPLSTFSIDVDTAAYSNLRRMLTREGRLPPHDAVRLEEMINYFDYDYAAPDDLERPLAIHTELMASPWNPGNQLLMVGMKGYEQDAELRPNANLVFLVDVSGSMQSPDKLGLVKRSLQLLVAQMQEDDRIALVVYAGAAGMVLDSTSGSKQAKILGALESLTAGGSTNGAAGIELAYRIAEENKIEGGINRVIIASDGDLNVGVTSIDALTELIGNKRENGIALTSLGFGTGNYNYSLMEQLADVGNGNAAYIDTLSEARKVLVEEMQSTLLTIAKDVKIQVEFNPDVVAEYRLIGYENRLLNREDFRNDKVDAGEVGAGHTVTALYEISLKGSTSSMIPDRRYGGATETTADFGNELAYVNVRYKLPEQHQGTEFGIAVERQDVGSERFEASDNIRFAAAVAGFGQLLRGGVHTNNWSYDELLNLARQSRGDDHHGYRSEMVKLVELAKVL